MNNSINYSGFVDLLDHTTSEISHHAESLPDGQREPAMLQMVSSVYRTKYCDSEIITREQ